MYVVIVYVVNVYGIVWCCLGNVWVLCVVLGVVMSVVYMGIVCLLRVWFVCSYCVGLCGFVWVL